MCEAPFGILNEQDQLSLEHRDLPYQNDDVGSDPPLETCTLLMCIKGRQNCVHACQHMSAPPTMHRPKVARPATILPGVAMAAAGSASTDCIENLCFQRSSDSVSGGSAAHISAAN